MYLLTKSNEKLYFSKLALRISEINLTRIPRNILRNSLFKCDRFFADFNEPKSITGNPKYLFVFNSPRDDEYFKKFIDMVNDNKFSANIISTPSRFEDKYNCEKFSVCHTIGYNVDQIYTGFKLGIRLKFNNEPFIPSDVAPYDYDKFDIGIELSENALEALINKCKNDEEFIKADVYDFLNCAQVLKYNSGIYLFAYADITKDFSIINGYDSLPLIADFILRREEDCKMIAIQEHDKMTYWGNIFLKSPFNLSLDFDFKHNNMEMRFWEHQQKELDELIEKFGER